MTDSLEQAAKAAYETFIGYYGGTIEWKDLDSVAKELWEDIASMGISAYNRAEQK